LTAHSTRGRSRPQPTQ